MGGPLAQIDPIVWVALIGLAGVLVGHVITGWSKKQDRDLAALDATVQALREEVNRLTEKVGVLEGKLGEEGKRYRAALRWSRDLHATIDGMIPLLPEGVGRPPIPNPPDIIRDDL
jgi:hypothetical protein